IYLIAQAAYLQFLETGKYSDLVIECQGVEFKVHRVVVCAHSPMLDAACGGQFQEAQSGRITLPEQQPHIMARAIEYMLPGNTVMRISLSSMQR
ncbi:hypothetical protein A1O1_03466, partial [Capronia coronata CBS 617.96]